jgi:tetratricopeptide (TPR) repeat protein
MIDLPPVSLTDLVIKVNSMKNHRLSFLSFTLLSLFFLASTARAAAVRGVVVSVPDYRTISVSTGAAVPLRVRLRGVGTSKNSASMAEVARQHLSQLVMGKDVSVETIGLDQTGDIVGAVFAGEMDVAMQMVRDGAAPYDGDYDGGPDASTGRLYAECESAARGEKRGVWQDRAPADLNFADASGAHNNSASIRDGSQPTAQVRDDKAKGEGPTDKAERLSDAAHGLLQRGQAQVALPLAREAVELAPASAEARKNLALALADTGQYDEALKHCREALRLDPKMDTAHNVMGKILHGQGRLAGAVAEYREAIRLNPGYAKAHYNLGVTLYAMGRFGEALSAYQAAERLAPEQPSIKLNMGWAFLRLGRANDARAKWQDAAIMGDPVVANAAQEALRGLP